MVVRLTPEAESRLQGLAATTVGQADELIEYAMAGYLAELAQVREMLDTRYDDVESGGSHPSQAKKALS
jgi:hypothetical protein